MSRAKTGIERVTAYAHSAPLAEVETAYLVFGTILRARRFGETDVPGKAPEKPKRKPGRPRKVRAGKAAEVGTEHVLIVPNKSQP